MEAVKVVLRANEKLKLGKSAPKAITAGIAKAVDRFKGATLEIKAEISYLKGRLDGRKDEMERRLEELIRGQGERETKGIKTGAVTGTTYAGIVGDSQRTGKGRENIIQVPGREIPVKAVEVKTILVKKEGKRSEEVRKVLEANISPKEVGVKVKKVLSIRNGVAIEVETDREVEVLAEKIKEREENFEIVVPKKKRPVMMIYDIRKGMTDEEIKDEIWERNILDEVAREAMDEDFRIRSRKTEGKVEHIIVEVLGEIRKAI